MIEVTHDNCYLEKDEAIKETKVDEQYRELKSIIPEQGLFKRRIELLWGDEIIVRDRRHKSMASMNRGTFPFSNIGIEVARFYVTKKKIFLADKSLFDLANRFAEKWGYDNIETQYQF